VEVQFVQTLVFIAHQLAFIPFAESLCVKGLLVLSESPLDRPFLRQD
jgi:hypothetical protein